MGSEGPAGPRDTRLTRGVAAAVCCRAGVPTFGWSWVTGATGPELRLDLNSVADTTGRTGGRAGAPCSSSVPWGVGGAAMPSDQRCRSQLSFALRLDGESELSLYALISLAPRACLMMSWCCFCKSVTACVGGEAGGCVGRGTWVEG